MNGVPPHEDGQGRETAEATRRVVVDVALSAFVEFGYRGTTVGKVAAGAGVTEEWVTRSFGTKAALAKTAFDVALAGDHDEISLAERPEAEAVRAEPTAGGKLRLHVVQTAERHRRSAQMQLVLRDEHPTDESLSLVWETVMEERMRAMLGFADHLLQTGGLRAELGLQEVADVLWWGTAVDHFALLVLERGWTQDRYAAWLGQVLVSSLT